MATGLAGKIVVVTGAAGGIGAATCRRLAREGAQVWAVDREAAALDDLVQSLDGTDHRTSVVDLTDLQAHAGLVTMLAETGRPIAGFAHLAAVLRRRNHLDEVTEDDWDFQIDTNLKATFFLDRAIANLLIQRGEGGSIVNFTSQGWWTGGFGGSVVYAASKGGVVSLTRGLARSFAPDVRVNAVSPGGVETPMMREGLTDEGLRSFVSMVPLGRLAAPDELAGAVVFLASEASSFITGAVINVSGGQLMY